MQIKPRKPTVKGPAAWFTGDVWMDGIARGEEPSSLNVSAVHFTPGARTAWHSHSLGQTLYVTRAKASSGPAGSRSSPSGLAMSSTPPPTSGTGTAPHPTTS